MVDWSVHAVAVDALEKDEVDDGVDEGGGWGRWPSGGSQPRSPDMVSLLSSSMEVIMLSWPGEGTPLGVLFGVSSSDEMDCDTNGGADGYDP